MAKVRVVITQDEIVESPREWDNAGHMVCWHPNHVLGDKHAFEDPDALRAYFLQCRIVVQLPLYLYDHSGISMSVTRGYPFNCLWDSGQVGVIYMTELDLKREYNAEDVETQVKALDRLYHEVTVYNQFIMGEVYCYVIEEQVICKECKHETWEHLDSCGGFFGHDPKLNGMMASVENKYKFLFEEVDTIKEVSDG